MSQVTVWEGRFRTLYATAAALQLANPVLLEGEPATESDTLKQKIGDGVTSYNDLDYLAASASGSGTVTSVGLSAPTGFSVSGSPVTGSGTLALTFAAGYSLPATADQDGWDAAALLAATAIQPGNAALSDAREWTAATVEQAEAEAGTATTRRAWTAQRVFQAIAAWWGASGAKTKLDGIQAGAEVNVQADWNASSGDAAIQNKPTIPSTAAEVGAATAAQGALADSAVQPEDLAAVATSGAYGDLSGRPTLLGLSSATPQAPGTPAAGSAADASRADHVHALPPTVTTEAAGLMRPVDLGDVIVVACSDETTNLAVGTARATFRMPWAATLTGVRAGVNEAPTGSALVIDINEAGATLLSTKLSINAAAITSVGATPAVISDSALADDAIITIDIDQVGSTNPGKGLKVTLYVTRVQP